MSKLLRQLTFIDIFAMASGSMISSGLFILPAIVYSKNKASVILIYILASILVLPAVLAKSELSTAMPKAGGSYFYVDRSLGSAFGFFTGLADWFSVAMKSAFALVGMAVFIDIIVNSIGISHLDPETLMKATSLVCCCFFMLINVFSVKHSSRFQNYLVLVLLLTLLFFIVTGLRSFDIKHYKPFYPENASVLTLFGAVGMVFVSFGGLTKVTAVAEEVKDPQRTLPLGMLSAWFVVSLLYFVVIALTVGAMDNELLKESLTPISDAAKVFAGTSGYIILSVSAMAAFITTSNAGLVSASRSLMAMSRDGILPAFFGKISDRFHTPYVSILITGSLMILAIVLLDLESLVKTASALMLTLFVLDNLSMIIMRSSKLQTYRPTFIAPLYPYIQIFAILIYIALIISMGIVPILTSLIFVVFSALWYRFYIVKRITRTSALMHLVTRLTDKPFQSDTLEKELRDVVVERDSIVEDRFDEMIHKCDIIDLEDDCDLEETFKIICNKLQSKMDIDQEHLYERLLERESQGSTVIDAGIAIPHIVVDGENRFEIMLLRSKSGIKLADNQPLLHCIFVLVGTKDQRNYHLRALMSIAQIAQQENFLKKWLDCRNVNSIRNMILLSNRTRH